MADRAGQCAMLRGRVNQWPGLCSEVPAACAMHVAHAAPRRATCVVRYGRRRRSHRWREGMREQRCRVWHIHAHRGAHRSHRHGATVTRMHRPYHHSIVIEPIRHDLDQRMCVAAIHGMNETAGAVARNRSLLHRAVIGARSAYGSRARRSPAIGRRPMPVRKRTIDSNAAQAISERPSARICAPAAAGGRASTRCRTSGERGRAAHR
ncbi:hypothetical protein BLA18110_04398 [Burkholderia lata]|nr:hypothetical protein BLA18110_04398 [Burkholderia lata]